MFMIRKVINMMIIMNIIMMTSMMTMTITGGDVFVWWGANDWSGGRQRPG